jgi:glycosyltransferase involved in cell wall biosynthesis
MRILFVNTYDIEGGAAIAAYRLYRAVKKAGMDADFFCMHKKTEDDGVIAVDSFFKKLAYRTAFYIERQALYAQYKSKLNTSKWSFNILPNFIMPPLKNHYDLIHLHWIGDSFISMSALQKIKIPVVWTLHDSWAFTGGCHVPFDCRKYIKTCRNCPQLQSGSENDLSLAIFNAKRKCYDNLKNLKIVTPSNWLAEMAGKSSLLSGKDISVIPNGIDGDIFAPVCKDEARNRLGLNKDKKIVMFSGVAATSNVNKGFHFLIAALKKLSAGVDNFELLVVGDSRPDRPPEVNCKINYSGRITDESAVALYTAAADVVVVPSMLENLPNTIIEAFAAATPVVAFNVGGISDIIDDKTNGCLVKPFDAGELAGAISWILADDRRRQKMSASARNKYLQNFTVGRMASDYIEFYRKVMREK